MLTIIGPHRGPGGCEIVSVEVSLHVRSTDPFRTGLATLFTNGTEFFHPDGRRDGNEGVAVANLLSITGNNLGTSCPGLPSRVV